MAMVDPFTPSAFSLNTLTGAINNLKYTPARFSKVFEESGVSTLDVAIEEQDGILSLVDIQPRGAPGKPVTGQKRKIRSFRIPHLPERALILADEVQGVRVFGMESQSEMLTSRINDRLSIMRRNIDYTIESHRTQAVMGNYYDANGDLQSLFTTFGVSQQTHALALSTTVSSAIRKKMFEVLQKVNSALDGVSYNGITVLCGDAFWAALLEDKDVKATYLNQIQANELRGNPEASFTAFGANWEWYRGTSSVNLGNDAYAIPIGVPGLCISRFAPANYVETVNTLGLPYYAKSEPIELGKGYVIEAQSNPLNLVTRPAAIIKLTIS